MVAVFENPEVDHAADEGGVDAEMLLIEDCGEGFFRGTPVEVVEGAGESFGHGEGIERTVGEDAIIAGFDAGDLELFHAKTFGDGVGE